MLITTNPKERKNLPITTGVLDYFPEALLEVSRVSMVGNQQHNPGQPLHWDKSKSKDEADALVRHLLQRGTFDTDGTRHSAKIAWRALALLQREIEEELENEAGYNPSEVRLEGTLRNVETSERGRIVADPSRGGEYTGLILHEVKSGEGYVVGRLAERLNNSRS